MVAGHVVHFVCRCSGVIIGGGGGGGGGGGQE